MKYEEWAGQFKPIMNPYTDGAFDGKMFETYGKELDHVHRVLENNKHSVWTYIESNGHSSIVPGYRHIDRLGYFITEVNCDNEALSVTIS